MLFLKKIIGVIFLTSIGLVQSQDVDDHLIFVHTVSLMIIAN